MTYLAYNNQFSILMYKSSNVLQCTLNIFWPLLKFKENSEILTFVHVYETPKKAANVSAENGSKESCCFWGMLLFLLFKLFLSFAGDD